MKLGSSRWGNDFEKKVREFVAKYGFEIIAENETIKCTTKKHSKQSHEIDLIAEYSSDGYPLPPQYGPYKDEKFLVSTKGGLQIGQPDLDDARNQLECLKKSNEYAELKKCVVICEHSSLTHPVGDLFVWDEKFMHLLSAKMRIFKSLNVNKNIQQHFFPELKVSLMFQISTGRNPFSQRDETTMMCYVFNENPIKSIGKKTLMEVLFPFRKEGPAGFHNIIKNINVYSPSGFMEDLLTLKGSYAPEDKHVFFSSFSDLSVATWVPSIDNDFLF